MRKASSVVKTSNIDKKPEELKLRKILEKEKGTKERNKQIAKAYKQAILSFGFFT